ncbi:MAG: chorismate synthase [Coriobacteriaceae bacterium]|jgi:chorismate synthase|nr:chorismate synthase [Coriobacteriaceae bacterium]
MHYITAGESHGPMLTAIVSGVPAGLKISEAQINTDLARRQGGYGRGGRQDIETDTVRIASGLRFGRSLGTPITLQVMNRDWENWSAVMALAGDPPVGLVREVTPRPGHADLVGAQKIGTEDCRDILERASARETAARVAAAGIAREFLADVGVEVFSYVNRIGNVAMKEEEPLIQAPDYKPLAIETSEVRCPDEAVTKKMKAAITKARKAGESLGGTFRVVALGLVPGLGGYAQGSDRLNSRLAAALCSIPAIKGLEFGLGFAAASLPGSQVHDPIIHSQKQGFSRASNNAGGLEGGMTTGLPLIITVAMKPIPTLANPLPTVNMDTLEAADASKERGDVCAVPAAAVVAEGEVAFVLAEAYLKKFGGDTMGDIKAAIKAYCARLKTMAR